MLMDILMEALMSMDDESLDYVLESCDAEELEIISDAMEMIIPDRNNPNIQSYAKFSKELRNARKNGDDYAEANLDLIEHTRQRPNGKIKGSTISMNVSPDWVGSDNNRIVRKDRTRLTYNPKTDEVESEKRDSDSMFPTLSPRNISSEKKYEHSKNGDRKILNQAKKMTRAAIRQNNIDEAKNNLDTIAVNTGKKIGNFVANDARRTASDVRHVANRIKEAKTNATNRALNKLQAAADRSAK